MTAATARVSTRVGGARPVVVERLAKIYPAGTEALAGISFDVQQGEIFGLLGPNGAGKTTTMGVLTTLVRPTAGRAVVDGHDVMDEPLAVRRAIGVVFQETVLDNDFTGLENLRLHARLWRVADPERRIHALLSAVDLERRAADGVRAYSGGMRRRLEIARALLARPRVLLLDEPTLGLDPIVRQELWHLIRKLQEQEHTSVLVSTHYLEEAEQVCDRVAIIDHGRIVASGTPRELIAGLGSHILELRTSADPTPVLAALRAAPIGTAPPLPFDTTIVVASDADPDALAAHATRLNLSGLGVSKTTVRPATLNDVFLQLTLDARRRPDV